MDVLTTRPPRLRAGSRRRLLARTVLGFFVVGVLATPACYTLLQHPGIQRRNYQRPTSETPCTSCHARTELRGFLKPERIARERGVWERLNHPWWFDSRIASDTTAADTTQAGAMR